MANGRLLPIRVRLSTIPLLLLASCCGRSHHHGMTVVSAHSDGPVKIHQMGGDIDVKEAPQGANLETMGGNITVEQAGGSVEAETMGGEIRINSAFGPIKASTMGGDIKVRIAGTSSSQRDIQLSSKAGTIALTVPKDFPMQVGITLAYTKNSSQEFRISEHLGLTQRVSSDWESGFGSPRKFIRASGRVGNGENRVTIDTINGDVIIRQE